VDHHISEGTAVSWLSNINQNSFKRYKLKPTFQELLLLALNQEELDVTENSLASVVGADSKERAPFATAIEVVTDDLG
jgi:hypothetical protein